ncbi:DNA repair protein RecN [Pseudohongiella sp.]|uniref:DNA repair protein RecN n=1 Tax=marine sediment metagenome TaxID=412755 RepID=A0A0F9W494_9ZZZZ|nr:DNA repair protein RecN [Pseudohongiella sp.]HDZ10261.1 DNA repair protein RecN [Pseudohongiella sp.]HEA64241.1 DNA repair protein RecN [Pseudohongiella sp.]
MLTHLSIRNYAIAEQLDIEFKAGMTAITGETGAGKSIILGALGLALGDRADRDVVRSGSERADISAEFDVDRLPLACQWLSEHELTAEGDHRLCLLRRSVAADGRSRAWINNSQVTLQAMTALGSLLMDIHSQHEHHSLLQKPTQQMLLDDFGGQQSRVQQLRQLSEQWKSANKQLSALQATLSEQAAQNELARYQLTELEELALGEAELDELEQELDNLSNAESRIVGMRALVQLCHEDDDSNISQSLHQALSLLRQSGAGKSLANVEEMLNTALIQVDEAASELNRQLDQIEINPARLEELNARLASIHQLARKHKVRPEELGALQQQLEEQLAAASQSTGTLDTLIKQTQTLQTEWLKLARELSSQRQQAARKLTKAVNEQLGTLGMADARLSIELQSTDSDKPQPHGLEQVEFLISTNPGQPAKPLARIASGGELSRISLAIQVITAMTSDTPSLVFDEVDVGIGGGVARVVGKLLKQLGTRSQVLCVTHQPLVASLANQHLLVSKEASAKTTKSRIYQLDEEERLQEIARMLGGDSDGPALSNEALAHARELTTSA